MQRVRDNLVKFWVEGPVHVVPPFGCVISCV